MKLIILGLLLSAEVFSQSQNITLNDFRITFDSGNLNVSDEQGQTVFNHSFVNPAGFLADLDEDGSDELVIIDSTADSSNSNYKFYICSALDSFYIADSIYSGAMVPYYTNSDELGEVIIVTGNYEFRIFDSDNDGYLPLSCWKYESGSIYTINDELYNIYISENEGLIQILDNWYEMNAGNCSNSLQLKGAIAAGYSNYINAGEQSLASQFIKNYYLCEDLEQFRDQLDNLLNKQE